MSKREPNSVSHLPPPVRKPPARIPPDWENPPDNMLIARSKPYLVLRVVTPDNAHLFRQAPLDEE